MPNFSPGVLVGPSQIAALFFCGILIFSCGPKPAVGNQAHIKPGTEIKTLPGVGPRVFLTFDLCGGPGGNGYDGALYEIIAREHLGASIFVTRVWAEKHPAEMKQFLANPAVHLENHGARHRCLRGDGKGVYGLPATASHKEIFDEVEGGRQYLKSFWGGMAPSWFRAAGLETDALGREYLLSLGLFLAGGAIALDEGATASPSRMAQLAAKVKPGDIVIVHLNHPEKPLALGFQKSLAIWRARGWAIECLPRDPNKLRENPIDN